MIAAVVREHGGVDAIRFEERPAPPATPGHVRVRVLAAGLNHLDTWVRRGVPGHTFPLPLVLGSDGAGVIDAIGEGVTSCQPGDEVVVFPGTSCGACAACLSGEDQLCREYRILGEARDGTCAGFVVVPAANVAPKPARLSFPESASFALVFQTAWSMLVRKASLRAGETVLVHAGGSGVGSAAIQIGKLFGATVFATAGSPEKCAQSKALGADEAIDYRTTDFADAVKKLTGKRGVDVVVEHVGALTFDKSLRCLARGGRLVTCGATTGGKVELSLHQVFFKNLAILGNTMGSKGDLWTILRLIDAGRLRPVLARTMPLSALRDAHRLLEERAVFGKIAVEPDA